MAEETQIPAAPKKTFGEILQSINKPTLFGVLVLLTAVPLWLLDTGKAGKPSLIIPDQPDPPASALFQAVMQLPENSTVLIQSDWTNSTRGESGGQFKALLRMLIRKHIKACMFSLADPQAPQVVRDVMRALNEEQRAQKLPPYVEWNDWVHIGYFPSAEATSVAMAADLRRAFAGRKSTPPAGTSRDVFLSPVMHNVHTLKDIPLYILITASNTSNVAIERLYGAVPLAMMVTGVMGPETQVYYDSKQLVGLSAGLKGVYDIESLMNDGETLPDGSRIEPFKGVVNLAQGAVYMVPLHFALGLLILAVVIGNVGMFLSRRQSK
jgi:hypothetical protein